MNVRKAIIPAAGLGTRFLPATKALPKEMLPIVDKPTIQYIIEEAVSAGIEDIIIVTGRGKRAIEDHFDKSYELEDMLAQKNKVERLKVVQDISNLANIHYIRQKEPLGLGHAIWCARKFIGDEPFAVMLGDDIVVSDPPCMKQLIDMYAVYEAPIIGVQSVQNKDVSKYGIIDPKSNVRNKGVIPIDSLVEKPELESAPSNFAIMGRYLLTPAIFGILEELPVGTGGEVQLTDALNLLNEKQAILAYEFTGKRYDIGDKLGFIEATLEFSLKRDDLKDDVRLLINTIQQSFLAEGKSI